MDDIRKRIQGLESELASLKAATGVSRYTDGKAFGNPEQDFDDKDVDLGGQTGPDGKVKSFIAMMKKKHTGG
jgi:hypothetical protein